MADKQRKVIKECAGKIADIVFDSESLTENYWLFEFFNEYLKLCFPEFEQAFNTVWEKQTDNKTSYGDFDYTLTKVFEGQYKEPERLVKSPFEEGEMWDIGGQIHELKTLLYKDHSSCANHTSFLIQQDKEVTTIKYHIRIIYDKSDYTKNNQYVNKPNLKWYKDRGYIIDYVENLHMTPLGGCYGDCRDNGFITTFKKNMYGLEVEKGTMSKFHYYQMVVSSLIHASKELTEGQ
jgi:hypothetical protein